MKNLSYLKKIIITALCVALCVVLPMAFHFIPNAGSVLCPMHIPVLLCGLICGWSFGGLCGLIGPLLSFFLTDMPPFAILPSMSVELLIYGVVSGVMAEFGRIKKPYLNLYVNLIVAMLAGKIVGGLVTAAFFSPEGYSFAAWATTYFVTALPAIVIQLLLIPTVIVTLEKSKVISVKYTRIKTPTKSNEN